MFAEFFALLSDWVSIDTRIVITGALAAMSCALPGTWLLLRRQSLLGDALSHSILPGIVLAYLALHWLETRNWVSQEWSGRHLILFLGAAGAGVLSAVTTELIQRWGRLDRQAAIGVVFTTMFAFGLLLIHLFADQQHVDPDCVLYGSLEQSGFVVNSNTISIPLAAVINGAMLAINGILITAFFKELRLCTFDPGLAETVGLNPNWIQLALMTMTAATIVAAFESVGAILVVAMLIVPAATARLLTDRLGTLLILGQLIAASSALLGHVAALTVPSMLFSRLGYKNVEGASTTGMMAVASGCLFVVAVFASPRHGIIRRVVNRIRLKIRIAGEDILRSVYRRDESTTAEIGRTGLENPDVTPLRTWMQWLAQKHLYRHGLITVSSSAAHLTDKGRELAQNLVRSHRLWEAYMARHFDLPGDHLHATAEQVEHFLTAELQTELAAELDEPNVDPHGKSIPQSQ